MIPIRARTNVWGKKGAVEGSNQIYTVHSMYILYCMYRHFAPPLQYSKIRMHILVLYQYVEYDWCDKLWYLHVVLRRISLVGPIDQSSVIEFTGDSFDSTQHSLNDILWVYTRTAPFMHHESNTTISFPCPGALRLCPLFIVVTLHFLNVLVK